MQAELVRTGSMSALAMLRLSKISHGSSKVCETFADFERDSNFRSQSGEPYLGAPLLGPRELRQSVLEK